MSRVFALTVALIATPFLGLAAPAADTETQKAKAGPWGVIEFNYLFIEATDEQIDTMPTQNSISRWIFPSTKEAELRALFEGAKLPVAMTTRLLQPPQLLAANGTLTIFPSITDIESLTPEMRSIIYAKLALSPDNEFFQNPVIFTGGDVDAWLRDVRLRPELKEKIRRLSYRRGEVPVFSDIPLLLASAESDLEVRRILRLATRVRTLVARLKVTSATDFNALYEYWSDNRRSRDIRPFLESLSERPGETSLDLIHLLPIFARRHLYNYPTPDLAAAGRLPDCHWSSLNFFNRVPKGYYLDTRLATAHVLETFTKVPEPYRFGDVVFFLNGEGGAIHSCVYIADDIVFTKNGENILAPWILMRLPNVRDIYSGTPGFRVQGYRRKPQG